MVIADEVTFSQGEFGEENLQRLIGFTKDSDVSNRDWGTLLLSQLELNRADVVGALLSAADDPNDFVRGEAIVGLAHLGHKMTLSLVKRELQNQQVQLQIFEAAEILADASLVEHLECFQDDSDNTYVDSQAADALQACKGEN